MLRTLNEMLEHIFFTFQFVELTGKFCCQFFSVSTAMLMTSNFDAMPISHMAFLLIFHSFIAELLSLFSVTKRKNIGPSFDVGISRELGLNVFAVFCVEKKRQEYRQLNENSFK